MHVNCDKDRGFPSFLSGGLRLCLGGNYGGGGGFGTILIFTFAGLGEWTGGASFSFIGGGNFSLIGESILVLLISRNISSNNGVDAGTHSAALASLLFDILLTQSTFAFTVI